MGNQKDFSQIKKRITLYFDNALNEADKEDLLKNVKEDQNYNKIFGEEKAYRDYIKSNIQRPKVSSDLIKNIRKNIDIS